MRAITLANNGGTENLILTQIPTPKINENEVLVRVKAIGINPVDAFVRNHQFALEMFIKPQPGETVIIGWDISGVVEAVGRQVTLWKPGDEVFGMVNFRGHGKAYAEYVAAPADQLALKPENVSHEEAAAATLAALTAWQALVTYGKVKAGEKVLIHGAGGGGALCSPDCEAFGRLRHRYRLRLQKRLHSWSRGRSFHRPRIRAIRNDR